MDRAKVRTGAAVPAERRDGVSTLRVIANPAQN
jgi:hypothetical protein